MVSRVLKEPLLHFFLLGAAIFWLPAMVSDSDPLAADTIVVTTGQIDRMVEVWKKTRMRPPTQAELERLIDLYLREEVYYREALAMGLDSDDTIIRRRMRQKMEFLSHDLVVEADPRDEQLADFLRANVDRFRIEPKLSFHHVFLNRDQRGESLGEDALQVLTELQNDGSVDVTALGDPMLFPRSVRSLPAADVASLFGREFTAQIVALEKNNRWEGPVSSAYGLHLVFIDEFINSRVPELAEVRERVATEWRHDNRMLLNEEIYQSFKNRYAVVIEQPEWLDEGVELGVLQH